MQTDKGIVLATRLVEMLRERRILLPALNAVERVCGGGHAGQSPYL